jgi:hypothetical protein
VRAISVHVAEEDYQRLKSLAAQEGRPVAALIRQAMADYLRRAGRAGRSILEIPPHKSGKLLRAWTRGEIYDEMLDERR